MRFWLLLRSSPVMSDLTLPVAVNLPNLKTQPFLRDSVSILSEKF